MGNRGARHPSVLPVGKKRVYFRQVGGERRRIVWQPEKIIGAIRDVGVFIGSDHGQATSEIFSYFERRGFVHFISPKRKTAQGSGGRCEQSFIGSSFKMAMKHLIGWLTGRT